MAGLSNATWMEVVELLKKPDCRKFRVRWFPNSKPPNKACFIIPVCMDVIRSV